VKKESIFLKEVNALLDDEEVTLGEIADKLQSKGLVFLSLIAVMPFMQPIPIPGISTLLGFVIALQGLALMFLNKPLMTQKMRSQRLSIHMVESFLRISHKIYPWMSWILTGAGKNYTHFKVVRIVSGFTLLALALFLSLPLPIPGSNFLPALGIFCICLGLLEEDLLLIIVGNLYACFFGWLISLSFELILEQIGQWSLF
jgi:hypothetical protein